MFKLVVFVAVLAFAWAEPSLIASPLVRNFGFATHLPLAYSAPIVAPTPLLASAPLLAPAPIAIPAPITYKTAEITVAAEPVEQHGYRIAY